MDLSNQEQSMTASKHTRGPWLAECRVGDWLVISEADTYAVAYPNSPRGDQAEANARLIAAVPEYFDGTADLLAYEDAVEAGDDVQAMLLYASAVKKLRAAHLKATGGAA